MRCLSSFLVEEKCTFFFYNLSYPYKVYFLQSVLFSIFILPTKACICKGFFLLTNNNSGRTFLNYPQLFNIIQCHNIIKYILTAAL